MRSRGFVLGMAVGALPGLVVALGLRALNPWFLDRPVLFLLLCMGLPGLILGVILHRVVGSEGSVRRARGGLFAQVVAVVVLAALPRPHFDEMEVLLYGVDGATWDVIDPLIEGGELPAFEGMREEGSKALLRSMEPMFSPLLWTTIASGQAPDSHGVRSFHVKSQDCRVARFWDVAEQVGGRRVGLYKWLVTSPPRPIDGFVVPAWLAAEPDTWPQNLRFVKELELSNRQKRQRKEATRSTSALLIEGLLHGVRFGTVLEAVAWKLRERLFRPGDQARRIALERIRVLLDRDTFFHATWRHEPHLATFTLYATDALSHLMWRYHEPRAFAEVNPVAEDEVALWGEAVRDAYRLADNVLEELRHALPPQATLLVISDHGFKALIPGEGNKAYFAPLTRRLQDRLSEAVGEVHVSRVGYKLAAMLTDDTVSLEDLKEAVKSLEEAEGVPFYRWESLPESERGLGLTLVDEMVTPERISAGTVGGEPMSDYVRMDEAHSGDHDSAGIFLAVGPSVPVGMEQGELGLLDIAPTVLGLLGLPQAGDMTGQAIYGAPAGGPASYGSLLEGLDWGEWAGSSTDRVNEERLKQLGYIE